MFVNMHSRQTFAIVLLSWNKDTNERALSSSFTAKHGNFDSLLHVLEDIPIDRNLSHVTIQLDSLSNLFYFNLSILVARHVKQYGEGLFHFITGNTHTDSIILYAKTV